MSVQPLFHPPARAVLYLRQSTHKEDSISLELQENAGREYCARMGYAVVGVESDPGISGRTWKRPAVARVMESVAAGEADVVVLWKWSRLSRARLDWATAVDKVESVGGRIESATEPMDTTTSSGRLARGMLAEFAAFESERIGDVWRETLDRRVQRGLPATGGERFGYRRVDKATYVPDDATGPVLAECYARYVGGEPLGGIAIWMNDIGATTTTGARWDRAKIQAVLDSGFGAGVICKNGRTSKNRQYLPGAHEGVVSAEVWGEYRQRRSVRSDPGKISHPKYLLTGLVYCGDCGAKMHAMGRGSAKAGTALAGYGCGRYIQYKTGKYVTTYRPLVEAAVKAWVLELAEDVEAQLRAEAALTERQVLSVNDSKAVARSLARLDEQLGNLTIGWASGTVSEVAYKAAAGKLQERRDDLAKRDRVLRKDVRAEVDVRRIAMGLAGAWESLSVSELRNALAQLIKRVEVYPPPAELGGPGTGKRRAKYVIVKAWDD